MREALLGAIVMFGVTLALAAPKDAPIHQDKLGLSSEPLDRDNQEAPPTNYTGQAPGENKVLVRSYDSAPPMIPHNVDDYLPIGLRNECLNCHKDPPKVWQARGIKAIPPSHFANKRAKTDTSGGFASVRKVYGGFYNCSMCHTPQTDAPLLVKNVFKPSK